MFLSINKVFALLPKEKKPPPDGLVFVQNEYHARLHDDMKNMMTYDVLGWKTTRQWSKHYQLLAAPNVR